MMGILTGISTVISKGQTFISAGEMVIRLLTALNQLGNNLTGGRKNVETLFGCLAYADFTRGANYPRDDVDSLEIFKKWVCEYFRRGRHIKFHAQLAYADINKHLCSVGGPVDHIFTRYAMGYDKQGLKWERILPYIYPLEEARAKPKKIFRKWKNGVWEERPWFIAGRNGKECFRPETDGDGFLKKDFFMLIVAPNTFTDKAFERGQKHIIIAPAHGLAQLAVKNILDDNKILGSLMKIREKSEYFQAIIEVPAVLTKDGYAPTGEFPICEVKALDPDEFKKIRRFKDWYFGSKC